MSQSSPEGIILGKGSKLVSCNLSINKEKVFEIKDNNTIELLEKAFNAGLAGATFEDWLKLITK